MTRKPPLPAGPADDRPLCPRCKKNPVAKRANNSERLNTYCDERSCYDRLYDQRRDAAEEVRRQKEIDDRALEEGNRYFKLMQKKVADVVGTEAKAGNRIVQPLPRGGALIILAAWERRRVLEDIASLDKEVRVAADALSRSRMRSHKDMARRLLATRRILDIVGGDYLLSKIPEGRR